MITLHEARPELSEAVDLYNSTDDEPGHHAVYQAVGFHNTRELQRVAIHTFVQARRFPLG